MRQIQYAMQHYCVRQPQPIKHPQIMEHPSEKKTKPMRLFLKQHYFTLSIGCEPTLIHESLHETA